MKKIKILAAILAIAFVAGSSFSKPTFTDDYAIITEVGGVTGQSEFEEFEIVKLSDLSDWDCGVENVHPCTFDLDETRIDAVAPYDYSTKNFMVLGQVDEIRTVQLKVSGTNPAILAQSSNGQIQY